MVIEKMEFKNFKCFEDRTIEFFPDTYIGATNGVGKTTIVDGFFWCFFGKSSDGRSVVDFPKPIVDGEKVMNIETEVVITVDGVEYSRKLIEKWPRKRGRAEKVFDGYTANLFIDGVKTPVGSFKKTISETIGKEEDFKLLTSPNTIPNMKWDEMRSLLVGEDSIINEKALELSNLKTQRSTLVKDVDALPIKIESTAAMMSSTDDFDRESYEALKKEKDDLLQTIFTLESPLDSDDSLRELKSQKSDLELTVLSGKRHFESDKNLRIDLAEEKMRNLKHEEMDGQEKAFDQWKSDMATHKEELSKARLNVMEIKAESDHLSETVLPGMRAQYNEIYHSTCNFEDHCPTCKQAMPEELSSSTIMEFNLDKADRLQKNREEGKATKEKLDKWLVDLEKWNLDVSEIQTRVADLEKQKPNVAYLPSPKWQALASSIEKIKSEPFPSAITDAELKLTEVMAKIEEYSDADETNRERAEQASNMRAINIPQIEAKLEEYTVALSASSNNDNIEAKIKELKSELIKKSEVLAAKEQEIEAMEKVIAEIINLEEKKLNSRFRFTSFKLFNTQQNGEIKATCIPTVDGIPYADLNTAKKLDCGIDIVNTLQKDRGVSYPIFIDNSESSNNIEKTIGQSIKLYVTKDDELVIKEIK